MTDEQYVNERILNIQDWIENLDLPNGDKFLLCQPLMLHKIWFELATDEKLTISRDIVNTLPYSVQEIELPGDILSAAEYSYVMRLHSIIHGHYGDVEIDIPNLVQTLMHFVQTHEDIWNKILEGHNKP